MGCHCFWWLQVMGCHWWVAVALGLVVWFSVLMELQRWWWCLVFGVSG